MQYIHNILRKLTGRLALGAIGEPVVPESRHGIR